MNTIKADILMQLMTQQSYMEVLPQSPMQAFFLLLDPANEYYVLGIFALLVCLVIAIGWVIKKITILVIVILREKVPQLSLGIMNTS